MQPTDRLRCGLCSNESGAVSCCVYPTPYSASQLTADAIKPADVRGCPSWKPSTQKSRSQKEPLGFNLQLPSHKFLILSWWVGGDKGLGMRAGWLKHTTASNAQTTRYPLGANSHVALGDQTFSGTGMQRQRCLATSCAQGLQGCYNAEAIK